MRGRMRHTASILQHVASTEHLGLQSEASKAYVRYGHTCVTSFCMHMCTVFLTPWCVTNNFSLRSVHIQKMDIKLCALAMVV